MGMNRRGFLGRLLGGAAALASPRALAVPKQEPIDQIESRIREIHRDIYALGGNPTDVIFNISPVETPFSAAARNPRSAEALHEWTTDVLTYGDEERSKQG